MPENEKAQVTDAGLETVRKARDEAQAATGGVTALGRGTGAPDSLNPFPEEDEKKHGDPLGPSQE
jgi:hypothetical protein